MKIGIYSPNWVGDAVMSLPFVHACHRRYPNDDLLVVAKSWVSAVFENHPFIHEIIVFDNGQLRGMLPTTKSGVQLRKLSFDVFYLLSDSWRTGYLAWLSGSGEKIGFRSQWRTTFLTHAVDQPSESLHRSIKYLRLLSGHDSSPDEVQLTTDFAGIHVSENEREWAEQEMKQLALTQPIAIIPSSVAESRRVPLKKMEKILSMTVKEGYEILLFGGKTEKDVGDWLVGKFNNDRIRSICGNYSLRQNIALLAQCDGAIATDSGLGHVAANLGLKTVSLFGAGDPSLTAPYGPKTRIVREKVYCSPCLKNTCKNSEEPLLCLTSIDPKKLWEAYFSF